jgi:hypothetical protein
MSDTTNPNPGSAGTTTTTTTAAAAGAAAVSLAPGEEYKGMSPEAFKARLESERAAGTKGLLASLGVDSPDAIKKALETLKKLESEKLSETERAAARIAELEPAAKKVADLETRIRKVLEVQEAAIPEAKRGLLDLAPPATDAAARLEWIVTARAKGVFDDAAAGTTTTTTDATKAANSRAGGTAPATTTTTVAAKSVWEMTPEERKRALAEAEARLRAGPTT